MVKSSEIPWFHQFHHHFWFKKNCVFRVPKELLVASAVLAWPGNLCNHRENLVLGPAGAGLGPIMGKDGKDVEKDVEKIGETYGNIMGNILKNLWNKSGTHKETQWKGMILQKKQNFLEKKSKNLDNT